MVENGILGHWLEQAAFFERVTNSVQVMEKVGQLKHHVFDERTPVTRLFAPQLMEQLQWTNAAGRGNREFRLAKDYLARFDFMRAAIFAQAGYITKQLELRNRDANSYEQRKDFMDSDLPADDFKLLKRLRNAMAHGLSSSDKTTKAILKDAQTLKTTLAELIRTLEKH